MYIKPYEQMNELSFKKRLKSLEFCIFGSWIKLIFISLICSLSQSYDQWNDNYTNIKSRIDVSLINNNCWKIPKPQAYCHK